MNDCPNVNVKVLFFAKARELSGEKEASITVPREIIAVDLLNKIVSKFHLDSLKKNVILAINENWIDSETLLSLKNNDEVALIPPLSGVYNLVCSPEFGAVSLFVGTTRDNFEGKVVTKLEYEAYEGMAVKTLENLCKVMRQKFQVGNIAIYHRLGDVPVKDASVIIAISSTHRKAVLDALPFAIDSLKADVPIWKKEVYEGDEAAQWKENAECVWSIKDLPMECVQLYEEVIEGDSTDEVPSDMIQINANMQEINRRISSFINRKREQVNLSNVHDFCLQAADDLDSNSTCARVNAVLKRRKDSKSHLKVHRVENAIGPQTDGFDPGSAPSLTSIPSSFSDLTERTNMSEKCPPGAEERLVNAEQYLGIKKSSLNVFARLKAIEDKILYLESVSPEYFDFIKQEKQSGKVNPPVKKTLTSADIDMRLQQLESKLLNKTGLG